MSYCINPDCWQRQNSDDRDCCAACGTPLLIQKRYRLIKPLRELSDRSQTEVFEVEENGSFSVLKVLKDTRLVAHFDREAHILQRLHHPGIPKVEADGYFMLPISESKRIACLVMEKIAGQNLDRWLSNHPPISEAIAIDWLKQLLEILEVVHQNSLFHRDIKLSNVMLRSNGQLALIDFGTVRPVTNTYLAKVGSGHREVTSIISPGYTPLEQINGKAVPQSDFYAIGRSFVYLLTGQHPVEFVEDDHTGQLLWREAAPQISDEFAQLIDDLCAPFPGQRPANTQAILQRLNRREVQPLALAAPRKSSRRSNQQLQFLQLLNLGLSIILLAVFSLWVWAKYQPNLRSDRTPSIELSLLDRD